MQLSALKKIEQGIKNKLNDLYEDTEALSLAFLVIKSVFGCTRTDVIVDKLIEISPNDQLELDDITSRLQNHEPIQYILGKTEFYGREFIVNPAVLIPRPETEELVQLIIKENKAEGLGILDIGTGSGCIPISLYLELRNAKVFGLDIAESALIVARENAKVLAANIEWIRADILTAGVQIDQLDIIVSNPPYVTESEKALMQDNVMKNEPHLALFVSDNDPLIFYKKIAAFAQRALKSSGKLYFEINEAYGQQVKSLMEDGGFKKVYISQDLSGKDRIVSGGLS